MPRCGADRERAHPGHRLPLSRPASRPTVSSSTPAAAHRCRSRPGLCRSGGCRPADQRLITIAALAALAARLPRALAALAALRCRICPFIDQDGALRAPWAAIPRTCGFSPGLRGHAFGAPDRPAPAGMRARAQGSSRGSAGQPRVPQQTAGGAGRESRRCWAAARPAAFALGTHGAGRRRSAVPPHPPPGSPRRHAPRLTALAEPSGRPSAPGMLSPRKLPVKGTAYGRVPPLRSGQTLDGELPRQKPAPVRRTAGNQACGVVTDVHAHRRKTHWCRLPIRPFQAATGLRNVRSRWNGDDTHS